MLENLLTIGRLLRALAGLEEKQQAQEKVPERAHCITNR
jgi:hypothetical protein